MNKNILESQEKDILQIYFHLTNMIVLYAEKEDVNRNDVYKVLKEIVTENSIGICGMYYPELSEKEKEIYEYLLERCKKHNE